MYISSLVKIICKGILHILDLKVSLWYIIDDRLLKLYAACALSRWSLA